MAKNLRSLGILFSLLLSTLFHYGQDQIFSQYFSQRVYLNPAMAGYDGGIHFAGTYRKQWLGLSGTDTGNGVENRARFDSYMFSGDVDIPCYRLAAGGYVVHHELGQGYLRWQSVGGSLTVALPLTGGYGPVSKNEHEIRFGLGASASTRRLDTDALVFSDQLNPILGFDPGLQTGAPASTSDMLNSRGYGDMSFGMVYGDYRGKRNIRIGFAVNHLLRPESGLIVDQARQPLRYTLEGQYTRDRGARRMRMTPMIKIDLQRFVNGFVHSDVQYGVGFSYPARYQTFWWGVWMRTRYGLPSRQNTNTPLVMVGWKSGNWKYALSYGVPFSGVGSRTLGSIEFSVRFHLSKPQGFCCVEKDLLGDQF